VVLPVRGIFLMTSRVRWSLAFSSITSMKNRLQEHRHSRSYLCLVFHGELGACFRWSRSGPFHHQLATHCRSRPHPQYVGRYFDAQSMSRLQPCIK